MVTKNQVAVVTGAARGIGASTCRLFASRGWHVVSIDQAELPGISGLNIRADLSDVAAIRRSVEEVERAFGSIDALVNNAAEQLTKPLVETLPDEWDRVMATNVRAVYLLSSLLHPLLKTTKGAIVNVSSVHAVATSPGMAAYAASKGALVSLTRAMALEFASDGIRVNAVLPGAVDTPMLAEGLMRPNQVAGRSASNAFEALAARHPLGRVGSPEDIAQAILFLADTKQASFLTGQTLVVDGGATARLSTE